MKNQEYQKYLSLWEKHSAPKIVHEKAFWNQKAAEWANFIHQKDARYQRMEKRITATMAFLDQRGVLKKTMHCLDIGSGPAQFSLRFAQRVQQVTAADFSQEMLRLGQKYSEEAKLKNIDFVLCDFRTIDSQTLGWIHKFEFVFCSMTPAIRMPGGIDALMAISNAYCFTSCIVKINDPFINQLHHHFLKKRPKKDECRYFYALFNVLLLRGYLPETYYYQEEINYQVSVSNHSAQKYATQIFGKSCTAQQVSMVYTYLRQTFPAGVMQYTKSITYGWLLWDVRKGRDSDEASI